MTYAKADNYVELGFFGVQKFCLKDRIAHIHTDLFAGGVDAHRSFSLGAYFAAKASDFKSVAPEYSGCGTSFCDQTDTGGDAQLFEAHFLRKFCYFFDAGHFAVILVFHLGGHAGNAVVFFIFRIKSHGFFQDSGVQISGFAEGRERAGFCGKSLLKRAVIASCRGTVNTGSPDVVCCHWKPPCDGL